MNSATRLSVGVRRNLCLTSSNLKRRVFFKSRVHPNRCSSRHPTQLDRSPCQATAQAAGHEPADRTARPWSLERLTHCMHGDENVGTRGDIYRKRKTRT